jgi:hypothetical protein
MQPGEKVFIIKNDYEVFECTVGNDHLLGDLVCLYYNYFYTTEEMAMGIHKFYCHPSNIYETKADALIACSNNIRLALGEHNVQIERLVQKEIEIEKEISKEINK